MATVLDQLASASGQAKQDKNIALAHTIASAGDGTAVAELLAGLQHKTKALRHDCIKTLYEIAALAPQLVSPHAAGLIHLLDSSDNRMQWGAMTALATLAEDIPAALFASLDKIMAVADNGSVITKDQAVRILAVLSGKPEYAPTAIPLLLAQVLQAPLNQAPSYAEQALPVVDAAHRDQFKKILLTRIEDTEQESKRKRLEKVLKKLK
ncbi:MAG: hypothetical protein EOP49_19225 [Sphingobacteriales bacterium]|nr:MAG: hypothetical protein EOP49_19225 [Sphingobacteriales bacterium]